MSDRSELPSYIDPSRTQESGADVLIHGLPPLPEKLNYEMSLPVAYWKASVCAVVLFLQFDNLGGRIWPKVMMGTFARDGELWVANKWWVSKSWPHDPIAKPGYLRNLGGQAITIGGGSYDVDPEPGYPAIVRVGRVSSAVRQIALIQDDHEDRRPLHSHFGAWTVCLERVGPYQVRALDEDGNVLGSLQGDM
jgi:hypothetical protein